MLRCGNFSRRLKSFVHYTQHYSFVCQQQKPLDNESISLSYNFMHYTQPNGFDCQPLQGLMSNRNDEASRGERCKQFDLW